SSCLLVRLSLYMSCYHPELLSFPTRRSSDLFTQLGGIAEGFNLYLIFSISIMVLFSLKIITLRFIGFLFDVPRLVREYVSILYLSYFNTALMFLPVVIIMAFSPKNLVGSFMIFGVFILTVIFIVQFLRAGASIFKTYSLSKFYLFLYLCTLEIGPILKIGRAS